MKKRLTILIFIFSFGFTAPFYITSGAGAIAYITKEFGLDLIARTIARKLLTDLSNGVVNSINSLGVEDGQIKRPSFVQNWKKYLADAQTLGENQFRAQLNYTIQKGILCNDLKGPLALAFQASKVPYVNIGDPEKNAELKQNSLTPFQIKMRCTIPDKTRAEFKKDFAKGGGWDTWARMLEPQNNLTGATILAMEELESQRLSQEQSQKNEATAGQGFQGVKSACQGTGANAQCTFLGKTVTPAKVLGEGAANFLDSNAKFLVSSDELSEVLISMISAVTSKITNFTGKSLDLKPSDNITQPAPDFLPDAQQDRSTIQEIEQNTEELEVNIIMPTPNPTPTP